MFMLRVCKCTAVSVILSAIFLFILAVLSYASPISEKTITVLVYVSVVLCVFVGALLAAHSAQSKALFNAIAVSILYYVIVFALTFVINKAISPNTHFITMSAGILAAGILGAVMGSKKD